MTNARFSDFVTSGAFTLTLTRQQVAQLALAASGGDAWGTHALYRKGLVDELPLPEFNDNRTESRINAAGLLVAQLCQLAGLSNGDVTADKEIERLHSQLSEMRSKLAELRKTCTSIHARKQQTERELAEAQREICRLRAAEVGLRLKNGIPRDAVGPMDGPILTLRDPLPGKSDDELRMVFEESDA